MSLVWAICGASRGVGKTHLALRLCEALPRAVYVKCGHGPRQEGKPGHYVTSEAELEAFLAQHAGHARRVAGIDLSDIQIDLARRHLADRISAGTADIVGGGGVGKRGREGQCHIAVDADPDPAGVIE